MKVIHLTQGKFATVDDDDFAMLSKYKWHAAKINGYQEEAFHACSKISGKNTSMHRLILGVQHGRKELQVDHINKNTLDNRRSNLRLTTRSQNQMNRRSPINNTVGYKGVTRKGDLFMAQIRANNKKIYLGLHSSPEEAARAYDRAAKSLHGIYAYTNF